MKAYFAIFGTLALLSLVPFVTASNVVLNFLVMALLIALAGQGWNLLGGYGGQYSFGHAAFFGTGAYATAILQVRCDLNAWLGLVGGIAAGMLVGAAIGGMTFRSGLKGSYFSLVTLAFVSIPSVISGLLLGAIMAVAIVLWARKLIDGYTGDVLGATEQMFEIGFLLGVAAVIR